MIQPGPRTWQWCVRYYQAKRANKPDPFLGAAKGLLEELLADDIECDLKGAMSLLGRALREGPKCAERKPYPGKEKR